MLLAWVAAALAGPLGDFISPGPLASPHAHLGGATGCMACHAAGVGVSPELCMGCHQRVRAQVESQTGFHQDKGTACERCHPDHRGGDAPLVRLDEDAFDHDVTGFALHGAHADVACETCHTGDGFVGQSQVCETCHDDPHGSDLSDRELLNTCDSCHGDAEWKPASLPDWFDHGPDHTDFELRGAHEEVECTDCHPDARFVPTQGETCTDCHEDEHDGQFGSRACDSCHNEHSFAIRNFLHDIWPLEGEHAEVECEDCHPDGQFVGVPRECSGCHGDPHDGQFAPRDCTACHDVNVAAFALFGFDHSNTDFPLRRAHDEVACEDCHPDGQFAATAHDDCSTCHDDVHEGRFDPKRCDSCHLDGTWDVDAFDHDQTDFPLVGEHADVECADCHEPDGVEVPRPEHASCNDCHADDNPHSDALQMACTDCHIEVRWTLVDYAHTDTFPLEQAHAEPACTTCHASQSFDFDDADPACVSCHLDDKPAPHFDGACSNCHEPSEWMQTQITALDHAKTGFPLRGAHAFVGCDHCHDPTRPKADVRTACVDCHREDDPHRNRLGPACGDCHTDATWVGVRFRHAITGFPLHGAHRLASCDQCHATGFAGTPDRCSSCHRSPGDALHRDPLTRDCELCHRPSNWEAARLPHGRR